MAGGSANWMRVAAGLGELGKLGRLGHGESVPRGTENW